MYMIQKLYPSVFTFGIIVAAKKMPIGSFERIVSAIGAIPEYKIISLSNNYAIGTLRVNWLRMGLSQNAFLKLAIEDKGDTTIIQAKTTIGIYLMIVFTMFFPIVSTTTL